MTESQNKRLRNRHLLSWNRVYSGRKAYRAPDSESCTGSIRRDDARDAARSLSRVMMRRVYFAVFAVLIAWGTTPAHGVPSGSVSGLVCDGAGVPQIGAVVQLLRPDLSVLATVYTNANGRFTISTVFPGRYSLKAMGTSFLPTLRENVRVRSNKIG